MPPDIPVSAGLVDAAREGVRTAITAAERLAEGARFTYALCRPPGHHAGPAWFAGYCYLNTAAAAVQVLRNAGVARSASSTSTCITPTAPRRSWRRWGTRPCTRCTPRRSPTSPAARSSRASEREVVVDFAVGPDSEVYLDSGRRSVEELAAASAALVVSLGYDIVAGDPHGSWGFEPPIFTEVGRLLAASDQPVCVIQEGGYALDQLADCSEAFATGLLAAHRRLPVRLLPPYAGIKSHRNGGRR